MPTQAVLRFIIHKIYLILTLDGLECGTSNAGMNTDLKRKVYIYNIILRIWYWKVMEIIEFIR